MQFDPASLDAIRSADTVATLRLQTEAAVARTLSEEVSVAERLLPTDRDVAYQTLADAYGTSLLVQDSPRLQAGLNQHFVDAATALVGKDDTAFRQAAQAITDGAGRLAAGRSAGAGRRDGRRPTAPGLRSRRSVRRSPP